MLADADPQVQRGGVCVEPGRRAEAVPELIERLKSSSLVRQNAALGKLASAGPAAKPAVPALTTARLRTANGQAPPGGTGLAIGPDAKPALPALRKMESDKQSVVRDARRKMNKDRRVRLFVLLRLLHRGRLASRSNNLASGSRNPGRTDLPSRGAGLADHFADLPLRHSSAVRARGSITQTSRTIASIRRACD